jgi:hypothetical protein
MYNAARQQGGVDFFRWALTKGQNQSTGFVGRIEG